MKAQEPIPVAHPGFGRLQARPRADGATTEIDSKLGLQVVGQFGFPSEKPIFGFAQRLPEGVR